MEFLPLETKTGKVRGTTSLAGTAPKPIDFSEVFVVGIGSGGGGGGDVTQLVNGQSYVDVVFAVVQSNPNWEFLGCAVVNVLDPNPLNLWPGIVTARSTTGFTLQLNGQPDSDNYFLHWRFTGIGGAVSNVATTYLLSGPSSGTVSTPSTDFTVALPADKTVPAPVTVTPSDGGAGGTFTPTSVTLSTLAPSATFTYTAASTGAKTISTTNDGGLIDPASLTYTASASTVATTYTLTGPSSGYISAASTNFTVAIPGGTTLPAPVTITPHDGGAGGTFTPATVNLTTAAPSATFTYTPASYGAKTVSVTNSSTLTDPGSLTYTSLASTYSLSGPSSGTVGVASTNFSVALPVGGVVIGTATVTPHDGGAGGTFTPTTVGLTTASPSATFTYTPASTGAKTISVTNDGALTNPGSITYTVSGAALPTYTLSGPSSGTVSVASTNFTVTLATSPAISGTVTVTPSDGGGGGTFTPTTVGVTDASPTATFTYTPASTGAKTISVTNDRSLANPGNLTYTVSAATHLLNTLISYWKLDEASTGGGGPATPRADSQGTNTLSEGPSEIASGTGKINNAALFLGGGNDSFLTCASNSTLQVTGSFTFSLWVQLYAQISNSSFLEKGVVGTHYDYALRYYNGTPTGFYWAVNDGTGTQDAIQGVNVADGVWTHLVCWYDAATSLVHMRINDTATVNATATTALVQNTGAFHIGGVSGVALSSNALIDEVGFWKRLLTADEITALYNGGAGLPFSSFTS